MFDYLAVSGQLEGRMTEYADHLHEHMVQRLEVRDGRYRARSVRASAWSSSPVSLARYRFPDGEHWAARR